MDQRRLYNIYLLGFAVTVSTEIEAEFWHGFQGVLLLQINPYKVQFYTFLGTYFETNFCCLMSGQSVPLVKKSGSDFKTVLYSGYVKFLLRYGKSTTH